jgi:hypothetical protein
MGDPVPPGTRVRVCPARFAAEQAEWRHMGYELTLRSPDGVVVAPDPARPEVVRVALPVEARDGTRQTWLIGLTPEELDQIDPSEDQAP